MVVSDISCEHSVYAEFASVSWQIVVKFRELKRQAGSPMMTDPISDMLTRIRNAATVKKQYVDVPLSKIKFAIAKILEAENYVEKVEKVEVNKRPYIRLNLKYNDRTPVIQSIKRVSTPGRRVYVQKENLPRVQSGFGIAILSTSNGLMTNNEARKRKLGGEVICEVY